MQDNHACLDLATGLMLFGGDHPDLISSLNIKSDSQRDRNISESLTHELFHAQQIVLFSWLFDIVSDWHALLSKHLPAPEADRDYFIERNEAATYELNKFFSLFTKPRNNGLSIASIVEGHAFLPKK